MSCHNVYRGHEEPSMVSRKQPVYGRSVGLVLTSYRRDQQQKPQRQTATGQQEFPADAAARAHVVETGLCVTAVTVLLLLSDTLFRPARLRVARHGGRLGEWTRSIVIRHPSHRACRLSVYNVGGVVRDSVRLYGGNG